MWHACRIWFPYQGTNAGSLHWEHGVIPTGPPGKSLKILLKNAVARLSPPDILMYGSVTWATGILKSSPGDSNVHEVREPLA